MGAGLVFNLLRILSSIYRGQYLSSIYRGHFMSSLNRRQILVLDLSKTGSCLGFIKDSVRSCQVPLTFSHLSIVFT